MNLSRLLCAFVILASLVGLVACNKPGQLVTCERFTPISEKRYHYEQGVLTPKGFERTQSLEITYRNDEERKVIGRVSGRVLIRKLFVLNGMAKGLTLSAESIRIGANEFQIVQLP